MNSAFHFYRKRDMWLVPQGSNPRACTGLHGATAPKAHECQSWQGCKVPQVSPPSLALQQTLLLPDQAGASLAGPRGNRTAVANLPGEMLLCRPSCTTSLDQWREQAPASCLLVASCPACPPPPIVTNRPTVEK